MPNGDELTDERRVVRAVDEARAALERALTRSGRETGGAGPKTHEIELVLYVTESPSSLRALRNLERFFTTWPVSGGISLIVRDLSREPLGDDAVADRVSFTPLLVKRRPPPRERLIGDFHEADRLEELLRNPSENSF